MSTLFSGINAVSSRVSTQKTFLEKASEASEAAEKTEVVKPHFTYAVLNAEKLLQKKKYQGLLDQCVYLLDFTEEQKAIYFTPVVNNFVEFVQNLPETQNSYFSDEGGFIAHAFMRTAAALSMCRAYFQAEKKPTNKDSLTATESLWMYVLFSAGIFCGVGRIFSDLTIELYDENQKHLDRWNPLTGSILKIKKAAFYDYDFEDLKYIDLFSRRLSVLMAKELMPAEGFEWISNDKEAFSLWLALLEENQRDGGTLSPFLVRADAMGINTYFDEKRMQREYMNLDPAARDKIDDIAREKLAMEEKFLLERSLFGKGEKDSLRALEKDSHLDKKTVSPDAEKETLKQNPGTEAGIAFLKWLNNQMKARRLEFNTAIFYLPAGAIFLPTPLFEAFKKQNPYYQNTSDVIASFNKLQLNSKDQNKNDVHTMIASGEEAKKIEGVVLSNAQLILPKVVDVRLQSGGVYQLKSSDIQQYTHLMTPLQPVGNGAVMDLASRNNNSLMFAL